MLNWNEEIPVYAHYRLTISGEHKHRIKEDLQLLNVTLEYLFPWPGLLLPSQSVIPIATIDLMLMSSDNVRPIGLRKCPIRRTLPPRILVSQLCH